MNFNSEAFSVKQNVLRALLLTAGMRQVCAANGTIDPAHIASFRGSGDAGEHGSQYPAGEFCQMMSDNAGTVWSETV